MKWLILAGCPQWICRACGKARKRITKPSERYRQLLGKSWNKEKNLEKGVSRDNKFNKLPANERYSEYYTIGWTDCGCGAGWQTGIVLDPFLGSGTTAVVAQKLGRQWIGIELNSNYCEIAKKRILKEARQPKLFALL